MVIFHSYVNVYQRVARILQLIARRIAQIEDDRSELRGVKTVETRSPGTPKMDRASRRITHHAAAKTARKTCGQSLPGNLCR